MVPNILCNGGYGNTNKFFYGYQNPLADVILSIDHFIQGHQKLTLCGQCGSQVGTIALQLSVGDAMQ